MSRGLYLSAWLAKGGISLAPWGRFRLLLPGIALLLSLAVQAAEQYLLSPRTYEALTVVHELMDRQKYSQAREKLMALQKRLKGAGKQKAYEEAVILQTLGYVYSSVEHYPEAIRVFRASLALEALPAETVLELRYSLAQLHIAIGQYGKGIKLLEAWLQETQAPPVAAHVLAANAYYHLGQYNQVILHIKTAINLADEPPETSWYQLQLAGHLELKQYSQAAGVLEALIELQPENEGYWEQLATLYAEIKKDKRALAVQALAEKMGYLEGQALIYLSEFYRYLDIPYKGGQILQQALETGAVKDNAQNWENLADSWTAAREWERAIEAFSKAGRRSQKGQADLRRAQLLIELQRWDEAGAALQQALRKGGLDNPGQAQLLLGQVRYHQGEWAEAIQALELARRSPEYARQAAQWIKHVQVLQKQKALEQG